MVGQKALDAYRTTEKQGEISPVKLIHMLYERVLVHLALAEEGIREQAPKKRGENLGKAIAIITELQASIKSEDHSEAARFLRGLYGAILAELPRVSISQDVKVLRQARSYLERLKQIWEETAMRESAVELNSTNDAAGAVDEEVAVKAAAASPIVAPRAGKRLDYEVSQPQMAAGGLSVSI
ncbi:MAG: flagellar export chaperone FliS [Proteobacteria bacterium]|nr:flagellar export chaperone FliS [Pseudomonadota bacterium]MBU1546596.1 flagellar export chaperone FliS [Pseudomonadota bacterium]MBU2620683.1 flagellar export chaperone FliS [Pseudomonadota bacterium]